MKVLITGSRDWGGGGELPFALGWLYAAYGKDLQIIHGAARGVDTMAESICIHYGIPTQPFQADWNQYKKAAGPIRNRQMLTEGKPDMVVGFTLDWKSSKGTRDMITIAREANVPTYLCHQRHGWEPPIPPWVGLGPHI